MLGKVTGKKVDCLVCPVCLQWSCLKMKNWPNNFLWRTDTIFAFAFVMLLHRLFLTVTVNTYQTNKYLSTTFMNGWVLHRSLLHSVIDHGSFFNMDISQGSVATRFRCGVMFNSDYCNFSSESASERIVKIG